MKNVKDIENQTARDVSDMQRASETCMSTAQADIRMLSLFMDIGVMMLENGSEVKRVEDTIRRMGAAYGAGSVSAFAITSTLVVTINMPDGSAHTMSRGTDDSTATDFYKLERLNALSREYCHRPFSADEMERRIARIAEMKISRLKFCAGSMLAVAALTIFFGGTPADGAAAALFAIFICFMQERFAVVCTNNILFNLICSFAAGVLICLTSKVVPIHADKVMIGDIMLLIPGLALANAVKDVFVGDTITGSLRLVESVLWGAAIASGFALAMRLTM